MIKIYESSTALESHMIKNLLENKGISSQIEGEYLQGGVGELQAMGIVRLLVDDADYARARAIVDQWEAAQPEPVTHSTKPRFGLTHGLIIGTIVATGACYWTFNSPVTVNGADFDDDDFLDEKYIYKDDRLNEVRIDRNADRIYDDIYYYNIRGVLYASEADNNFDGIFEAKTKYSQGKTTAYESDRNQNGVVDYRENYQNNALVIAEFLDEASGKIRKRQHYTHDNLTSADLDTNIDGEFEIHYEYNEIEELK